MENLQTLPEGQLPTIVKQAFMGWKNYFKEGDAINAVRPKREEMETFLKAFPHYARPYWRNIEGDSYLQPGSAQEVIPSAEMAPFLKAAFYNFTKKT